MDELEIPADSLEHAVFASGEEHAGALVAVRRGGRFAVELVADGPYQSMTRFTLDDDLGGSARIALASPSVVRGDVSLVAAWERTRGARVVRLQGLACPGFAGP
ncbi:MAG: hypothetical protein M3Y87_25100 [Myxococcota bacterium]|nr:hypothetical protein [Myxococcota bacterium]